jgi:hypothetical protein
MELLVLVIIFAALSSGFGAIVLYDLKDRKKTRDDFAKAGSDAKDLVKSIQDAHNGMAQQIIALQDKVTAQEMRIGLKK